MRETIKGGMRGKAENENEGGKGKDRRSQFDSEVSLTYHLYDLTIKESHLSKIMFTGCCIYVSKNEHKLTYEHL